MKTIEDGGPAFPQKEPLTDDCQGMSLRDYFAAQCLQNREICDHAGLTENAVHAYMVADAMIAARNPKPEAAPNDLLEFAKWAMAQFQGDSGTGDSHWMQFPEYAAGKAAILNAGGAV